MSDDIETQVLGLLLMVVCFAIVLWVFGRR